MNLKTELQANNVLEYKCERGKQMGLKDIQKEDLRKMNDKGGIIFQGCGGEVQDWIDGINDLLTQEEILLDGTKFNDVIRFQDGNHTDLLFEFNNNVKINMGKLAIWRLKTLGKFEGIWMSDYVDNRLGGFIQSSENKQDGQSIEMDGFDNAIIDEENAGMQMGGM